MIHLTSPHTNGPFCSNFMLNTDVLTTERPPHNRDVKNLCKMCLQLYNKNIENEREKAHQTWINRSNREKIHDWLEDLDCLGESDMDLLVYPFYIVITCGLIIPAKGIAKLLLKAGI